MNRGIFSGILLRIASIHSTKNLERFSKDPPYSSVLLLNALLKNECGV